MCDSIYSSIVCAVSGSVSSIHAAMFSVVMAKKHNYKLKFVYVVDIAMVKNLASNRFFTQEESQSFITRLEEEGDIHLDRVLALAKEKGVAATAELRRGSVCVEVVNSIVDSKADVLVIGSETTHKDRYTLEYNASISVTKNDLIRACPCSVLMVNDPRIEDIYNNC